MKIVLLPSVVGSPAPSQNLTTLLINDTLALDAGSLGFMLPIPDQQRVTDVVLTHSHIDHTASLPIFLENVFGCHPGGDCVTVHAHPATIASLVGDMFNERLYPDADRLNRGTPRFVRFREVRPDGHVEAAGVHLTAFEVMHTVPTLNYRIESPEGSVVVLTDTAPAKVIGDAVRNTPNCKAVFLEVAFPNDLEWLAVASAHLTPEMFLDEVRGFPQEIPVFAIHVKPRHAEQIAAELAAGGLPQVSLAEPGKVYQFG